MLVATDKRDVFEQRMNIMVYCVYSRTCFVFGLVGEDWASDDIDLSLLASKSMHGISQACRLKRYIQCTGDQAVCIGSLLVHAFVS